MKEQTKLMISWLGALVMTAIFFSMMITENLRAERYFRARQVQRAASQRTVRLRTRKTKDLALN